MIKLELLRGDTLKKLIALIIILTSLFGGFYIYLKVNNNYGDAYVTITFDIEGEITKKEVLRGSSIDEPVVPTKEGYTFVGWDNDANLDLITKDQKYKAIYEINQYTISFNTNCDYIVNPVIYDYNAEIKSFETPVREGYEFVGWFYQGVLFDTKKMPAYDIELTAMWYSTITFSDVDGIKFETIKGVAGEYIEAPVLEKEDERTGQVIVWYKDHLYQEVYTFNRMPQNSIILYGRFEEIKTVDPGFLDDVKNGEMSNFIESYKQLVDYLEFMVYHKIDNATEIIIDYNVDNVQTALNEALSDIRIDTYVKVSGTRKGNVITIKLEFEEEGTQKASLTDLYLQLENAENHKESNRLSTFDNFAINKIEQTYLVTNSEQLYYVVERGYRPIFEELGVKVSDVRKLYEEIKGVLREIIDEDMTEYEKVHAIYDWLILNVTYDKRLKDYVMQDIGDIRKYRGFYLEGVFFDHRAVCDGISKAFVLMCRIEGIEAIRVKGVAIDKSFNHAWNKVRINNMWYIVDATSGGTIVDNNELVNHNFLFTNEDFFGSMYVATTYTDVIAYGEYNIYEEMYFNYDGYNYDFNITSRNELAMIIKWYINNFFEDTTIDMRISYKFDGKIEDEIKAVIADIDISYLVPVISDNNILIIKEFKKN